MSFIRVLSAKFFDPTYPNLPLTHSSRTSSWSGCMSGSILTTTAQTSVDSWPYLKAVDIIQWIHPRKELWMLKVLFNEIQQILLVILYSCLDYLKWKGMDDIMWVHKNAQKL